MNSARNSTAPAVAAMPPADHNADALDLIWGAEAIGNFIGKTQQRTTALCVAGEIPARKVGKLWVASRRKLREHFEGAGA